MTAPAVVSDGARDVLTLDVRPDGVAVITYDVPGASMNTLHASFADAFERVLDRLASLPGVSSAVLRSGKPDSFIVGADLGMVAAIETQEQANAMVLRGHRAIGRLAKSGKPVVAAIHGPALGGGFEVALACSARVLSDDPRSVLGLPEVRLGLIPAASGLQRLAAIAGLSAALELGLTGKNLRAPRALSLGVVSSVVPASRLIEAAAEIARELASGERREGRRRTPFVELALEKNPLGRRVLFSRARAKVANETGGHYAAPLRIIDVLEAYARRGLAASQTVEASAFAELCVSSTAHRLMEVFFARTALKKETGAGPGAEPRDVHTIATIGAGLMGAGIAYISLEAGYAVRLRDRDDASLGRGLATLAGIYRKRIDKHQIQPKDRAQAMSRLTSGVGSTDLASADLVIEAVFEDLELKQAILREAETTLRDDAIFASNTSSIPIARIARASSRPERVVGMHYFSPVHEMPLLEVIRTAEAAPEVVATAVAVGKRQGKTVIVVGDGVGFYTSRILGPYLNEATWLLMEGVAIDVIDRALVAWGFPLGPMTLLDEVGLDVAAHVGPIMIEAFGHRIEPPDAVRKLADDGRKGKKNGRGFYRYDGAKARGRARRVDESVYALLGLAVPSGPSRVMVEELSMRCSLSLVNEAFHCLGDGILSCPRDGDIGAIFGLGFPPFRGGPFRYADTVGAAELLGRIERYHARFGARWAPAPALVDLAARRARIYP